MSNDRVTAFLALREANKSLKLATEALTKCGETEGAEITAEIGEECADLMAALVGPRSQTGEAA